MTRVAAVDYGRRRIGLAVADPLGISVRGLPTLPHPGDLAAAARGVAEALRAEGVGRVVLGLPLHEDGRESDTSREVRRFGDLLGPLLGCPLEYLDEGLTSWQAEEDLKEAGRPLKEARRAGEVDRQAARRLLLAWLRDRGEGGPGGDSRGAPVGAG